MAVLHDYKCDTCELVFENILPFEQKECECVCGGTARRIVSHFRKQQISIFEPGYFEELGDDIPYISSKKQLAEECEKRQLVSRMLLDDTRNHGRSLWV